MPRVEGNVLSNYHVNASLVKTFINIELVFSFRREGITRAAFRISLSSEMGFDFRNSPQSIARRMIGIATIRTAV